MDHSAVHFFSQIFIILFVSVALGLLSQRFRQSLIMGYILAGVLLGPHTLGWIRDDFEIRQIAEIGLLFLMFSIGLEFSLKKLKTIRRVVFGAGSLQILATVAAGTGLGVLLGFSLPTGIFIGCVMSLSSTAVVSKELKDHAELDSPQGRLSMGILIFQDIAVIPMVIFLPILGTFDQALGQDLAWAGAKLTLFLLFAYVVGRYVFPTILRLIADTGSKELLVLTTLMLAFGMASASQWFGLSIVLGAFVAGILLSETEFNFQLRHIIFPFQEVFMSLFFISIGLLLDVNFLFTHFWQVLLLAIAIPLVNALVCSVVVLIFGYPLRVALFAALILAEIGEFSFVLIHVGATHQIITQEVYQLLLSLTAFTLLLTPISYTIASRLTRHLEAFKLMKGQTGEDQKAEGVLATLHDHVVICGFGPVGQNLAFHLKKQGIPFVITDMNVKTVRHYLKKGFPIFFGDAASHEILKRMGIERARAMAVTMLDPDGLETLIHEARKLNPNVYILARARYVSEIGRLLVKGVNDVVSEELESAKIFSDKLVAHT